MAHQGAVVGETVSRRAAQHRAAGRARAGARGQLHRRPEPAAPRPQHLSPLRRQRPRAARGLPHPGRRRPDRAVRHRRRRNGCSTTSTWSRRRSATSASICPAATTGSCRRSPRASRRATRAIYAMAVELVRHSDSRLDRQQLAVFINSYQRVAPLTIGELWAWPSMLKLALIENLRAWPRRRWRRAARALAADAYVSRIEREAGDAARTVAVGPRHRRRRPAPASGPRVRPAAVVDPHGGRGAPRRRRRRPRKTAIRSEHQRQAAAQVSVANAITSLRLCSALDWRQYCRVGQPGRAGAAARSRRRLRADGLPQPRPTAPGGRGAGRAERRRAGARRAEGGRKRPPGGRQRIAGRSRRPRRLPPHRSRAGATSRPTSPIGRGSASRVRRLVFAHATLVYLGTDRGHDGAAAGGRACAYAAARGRVRSRAGGRWCCSC